MHKDPETNGVSADEATWISLEVFGLTAHATEVTSEIADAYAAMILPITDDAQAEQGRQDFATVIPVAFEIAATLRVMTEARRDFLLSMRAHRARLPAGKVRNKYDALVMRVERILRGTDLPAKPR